MKVSKTDNRFKTGFPKPITGLPKKPILTSITGILEIRPELLLTPFGKTPLIRRSARE